MTDTVPSQYQAVPWRDYVDSRIGALQREQGLLVKAQEVAIEKADVQIAHRLEVLNDAKATLDRQSATFVTRGEMGIYNVEIKALQKQMNIAIGSLAAFQAMIAIGLVVWQLWGA